MSDDPQDPDNLLPHRPAGQRGAVGLLCPLAANTHRCYWGGLCRSLPTSTTVEAQSEESLYGMRLRSARVEGSLSGVWGRVWFDERGAVIDDQSSELCSGIGSDVSSDVPLGLPRANNQTATMRTTMTITSSLVFIEESPLV